MPDPVEYRDVQGLVRFGYRHMTEACYLQLRVKDPDAARAWLRAAPVTSADTATPPPSTATQVAFTAEGLKALGMPVDVVAQFSAAFVSGMAGTENRSRRLGDVGPNAPEQWRWGGPGRVPHMMVMLFAEPGGLDALRQRVGDRVWENAFDVLTCLDTSDLGGVEPFGFADGISQPSLDWERRRNVGGDQREYGNIVALGEFLLGYPNEYGKYTDRPLVAGEGAAETLPVAEDAPTKKDVGRNGTYLVMRDLRQDVRGFWRFVDEHAGRVALGREALAAAFVGRTMSGDPLVPASGRAIAGIGDSAQEIRQNRFTYQEDPAGVKCPFGAHIRRANPRTADFPAPPAGALARLAAMLGFGRRAFRDDLVSSSRFHRIIRRGREYGPGLAPADAPELPPPDDPERGLRFVCLNASIERQFEFLQNAWLVNPKFNGLADESDPLVGPRQGLAGCSGAGSGSFTMSGDGGVRRRLTGLPPFVTVQGGAYFFLPSLRALRYFAEAGARPGP